MISQTYPKRAVVSRAKTLETVQIPLYGDPMLDTEISKQDLPLPLSLSNQWNDFLLRKYDPYAQAKYEILLRWLGDVSGKEVLVVGCGSGELCAYLARRTAHVLAMDIDQASVDLAKDTAKAFGTEFDTLVSQLENMPETKKYDLVVATDVIEHIRDDQAAVAKMRRMLKPEGKLLMTVPALQSLMGYHDEALGHFRRYDQRRLKLLLTPHFEIEHMRYFGFFLIPVAWTLSRFLRRPYPLNSLEQTKRKNLVVKLLTQLYFAFERRVSLGLGTSLLCLAHAKMPKSGRP